jgi:hypothetical protein
LEAGAVAVGDSAALAAVAGFQAEAQVEAGNAKLDELVAALRGVLAEDLLAVVLYGSTVAPDQQGAGDDHDVLVLVRSVSTSALVAAAGGMKKWIKAGNPPPLVLTLSEWRASADVFAIEYGDLLERHRVVYGKFPTEGVQVRNGDLRQQLETEAMGKLLRLRRGLLVAGRVAKRQQALLDDALSSMLAFFRAMLRLHGEPVPASNDALCDRAAALAGFSAQEFRAVLDYRRSGKRMSAPSLEASLRGYHDALEKLVAHVDSWQVEN